MWALIARKAKLGEPQERFSPAQPAVFGISTHSFICLGMIASLGGVDGRRATAEFGRRPQRVSGDHQPLPGVGFSIQLPAACLRHSLTTLTDLIALCLFMWGPSWTGLDASSPLEHKKPREIAPGRRSKPGQQVAVFLSKWPWEPNAFPNDLGPFGNSVGSGDPRKGLSF